MEIERKYTPVIANYINERFKEIGIIEISYVYYEYKFTVKIELELIDIEKKLYIEIEGNSYDQDNFNIDYIKLKIFHYIREAILKNYIKGDLNYYE